MGHRVWWKGELSETYERMRHAGDVIFLGRADADTLARLVASATAMVYPSLFEGFGIPIVEAYHAEVPVITSNCTSMPEVAGDAALLIDPASSESITAALQRVATDEALAAELVDRGRRQRERFSWDITADLLWKSMMRTIHKGVLPLLALLALGGVGQAQEPLPDSLNLVYNGSFEDYRACPRRVEALGVLTLVEGWYQPTRGSADYYNVCGSRECGVPKNKLGYQHPHSGDAYCGIYCSKTNYREYLQTRLRRRLHSGDSIRVTFYAALSEESNGAVNTLGALFTRQRLSDTIKSMLLDKEVQQLQPGVAQVIARPYSPQVVNPDHRGLDSIHTWQRVSGTFVAEGGEQYVTFGNFYPMEHSGFHVPDSLTGLLSGAYYYLDDVSVECLRCEPPIIDVVSIDSTYLTPEQPAFAVGGTFVMKEIYFEFNKSTLLQESYFELMQLVALLRAYPRMQVEIQGHTDAKGSDSYNLKLSEARARAVADYVVAKGIDARRLQAKGYGKSQPVSDNDTDEGRALNRRVAFKILEM